MNSIIERGAQWNTVCVYLVVLFLAVAFLSIMAAICRVPEERLTTKARIKPCIVPIVSFALAIGVYVAGSIMVNQYKKELSSEITRVYNVKVMSLDKLPLKESDKPIEVSSLDEGDTRIYECYIKRDQSGQYKLYTRSDKGAYMELSGASKAMLAE